MTPEGPSRPNPYAGFQPAPAPGVFVRKNRGPPGVRAVMVVIGLLLLAAGTWLWLWRGESVILLVGTALPGIALVVLGARGWRSGP